VERIDSLSSVSTHIWAVHVKHVQTELKGVTEKLQSALNATAKALRAQRRHWWISECV